MHFFDCLYLTYFSIKSLIFKLATAVDDHEMYSGHSVLFVFPLRKISRSSSGVANPIFKLKLENSKNNKENRKKMHFLTLFFTIPKLIEIFKNAKI